MAIRKDILGAIYLNQNHYLEEMQNIPAGAEDAASDEKLRTLLRGAEGKLLYLNLTTPDVAFKTHSLSRVPPGTDLKLKVKEARNLMKVESFNASMPVGEISRDASAGEHHQPGY